MASMSVRYFSWSRRLRVRAVANVSAGANGLSDVQRLQQPLRVAQLFQQVLAFLVRDRPASVRRSRCTR